MNNIIVAKYSPENHCLADDGEELIIAPLNLKKTKQLNLKKDEWFFIGSKSLKPSKFAWVKKSDNFDIEKKIIEMTNSMSDFDLDVTYIYKLYNKIRNLEENTQVACHWMEIGTIHKTKDLIIHKVLFYDE